jgi:AraC-like DNA-binding protein
MPQHRTTLAADDRLRVERVVSHPVPAQWSPEYQVASDRLLLPATGLVELRDTGGDLLVDPLTAIALPAGHLYQLRPCIEGPRENYVVSETGAARTPEGSSVAAARLLSPRLLYRLRCHWRALQAGSEGIAATERLAAVALRAGLPLPRRPTRAVRRVRELLLAQPGASLSLRDLADAAWTTPFHLARQFRAQTGCTLHQYRHSLRLAAALAHLERGERDLAGLAHDLGYSSQSHFGAVFQRVIGTTPARARACLSGGSART